MKSYAIRTWMCQCITGLIAIIVLTAVDSTWFWSVLLGVLTMLFASAYWVYRFWQIEKQAGMAPKKMLRAFYLGQVVKYLILIIAIFCYIKYFQLQWIAVIIGILAIQLANTYLTIKTKGMQTP